MPKSLTLPDLPLYALTETSKATLWGRLRQHRVQLTDRNPGGGNHHASVFRCRRPPGTESARCGPGSSY